MTAADYAREDNEYAEWLDALECALSARGILTPMLTRPHRNSAGVCVGFANYTRFDADDERDTAEGLRIAFGSPRRRRDL